MASSRVIIASVAKCAHRRLHTDFSTSDVMLRQRLFTGLMEFAGVDKTARSKNGGVENAGADISARCGRVDNAGEIIQ